MGPTTYIFADDSLDMIKLFLEYGMDINYHSEEDLSGYTLLHNAASNGRLDVVTFLLESGADPTITTGSGSTALDVAQYWKEQVVNGYKNIIDESKTAPVEDYDAIIKILQEYMEK